MDDTRSGEQTLLDPEQLEARLLAIREKIGERMPEHDGPPTVTARGAHVGPVKKRREHLLTDAPKRKRRSNAGQKG